MPAAEVKVPLAPRGTQCSPEPTNPLLHVQTWDPWVLLQVASSGWQTESYLARHRRRGENQDIIPSHFNER